MREGRGSSPQSTVEPPSLETVPAAVGLLPPLPKFYKISYMNKNALIPMNEHTQTRRNGMSTLIDDARGLLHATSESAEETIVAARNRLSVALDAGKEGLDTLREKTVEGAKAAGHAVRVHPFQSLGIAFGVGALLGILIACRK